MTKATAPITAKKSYKAGRVAIGIVLRCGGYDDTARIDARTDLTVAQARELAKTIMDFADQADVATVAKAAAKAKRQKYVEREVAAGRMIMFGGIGG